MNSKIKEYFSIQMWIPLLAGIIIFKIFFNNELLFDKYIVLIGLFMSFIIGILILVKCEKDKVSLYINLGVSFLLIGILLFIKVLFYNSPYIDSRLIGINIFYYSNISYIFSFVLKTNEVKKIYINQSIIFAITEFVMIFGYLYINNFQTILMNCVGPFICIITILIFVMADVKISNKEESTFHYMYILTRLIYYSMICMESKYSLDLNFVIDILKYITYVISYIIFFEFYFNKLLEIEKDKLRKSEELQISLNRVLKGKNKELSDLNTSIEKSEVRKTKLLETIKDGIISIKSGRINYINNAVLDKYPFLKTEKYMGLNCQQYIEMFTNNIGKENIEVDMIKSNNNDFLYKKVATAIIENEEFDVYNVKLNYLESMIYFKDVTYIKKSHKIRSDYDEYIKEEKLKDGFYSNVSHELRTPINVISSAIQLNSMYLNVGDMIKIKNNNKMINQNCKRLIRTINNFIDTNKVQEGYLVPNFKVYNLVSVIENISLACNRYIKKIKNTLIFDSCEEEIYAKIDKDMMQRIMMNILSNMVKYGGEGGEINIDISLKDDKAVITINNNLYSISDEIIQEMFNKFSKLNKSLNREKEGSGLGMFLCKSLVELQGGNIRVETSEGKGTSFIIECQYIENITGFDICEEDYNIQKLDYSVDIEFSDIYL